MAKTAPRRRSANMNKQMNAAAMGKGNRRQPPQRRTSAKQAKATVGGKTFAKGAGDPSKSQDVAMTNPPVGAHAPMASAGRRGAKKGRRRK